MVIFALNELISGKVLLTMKLVIGFQFLLFGYIHL